jgi:hypothetical protein
VVAAVYRAELLAPAAHVMDLLHNLPILLGSMCSLEGSTLVCLSGSVPLTQRPRIADSSTHLMPELPSRVQVS